MMWPWPPPTRGDIAAIFTLVAILGALVVAFVIFPLVPPKGYPGFGSDWACSDSAEGGLICVKKTTQTPVNASGAGTNR